MTKFYYFLSKKIRNITITKRLIIIFIFSTILPVSLICLFSAISYQKSTYRKMSASMNQLLLTQNIAINRELKLQKNFSYTLLMDDSIQQVLQAGAGDYIDLSQAVLKNDLTEYVWSSACDNIIITNEDNKVCASLSAVELEQEAIGMILQDLGKSDKTDSWKQVETIKGSQMLVFSKKIYSKTELGKLLGYIHMVYDERRFFQNIYPDIQQGNPTLFILDEDNRFVSEQYDHNKTGTVINFENENTIEKFLGKGSFIDYYDSKKSLFVGYHNPSVDWNIMAVIPCSYINQEIYETILVLFLIAVLILLCSILPILLVSSTIISPVHKLSLYMKKVAEGEYGYETESGSNDEIGKLTQNCKNTVQHLVWVMKDNEQKNKRQRELELKMLQAQINPHFLFNTLNSFKYIAMLNNMGILEDGIGALCNLLRQTIMQENEFITLEQEFENIKDYCKVQEIRYAGKFELIAELSDEARLKKIPGLLLQPFVENSLVHGMKEESILHIKVCAFMEGQTMCIFVADDGNGIKNPEQAIKKSVAFNRIGLKNVKERLQIIYGEKSRLKIFSEEGGGTKIQLIIETEAEHVSGIDSR